MKSVSLSACYLCAIFFVLMFAAATHSTEKSWFKEVKESGSGNFKVTLDSNAAKFSLNEFQSWLVTVVDSSTGEAVSPARISVGGGMPMHGHGLPTQPQVTGYLGEGQYKVEGVKFNMHGQWILEFQITTADVVDSVVFEVVLDY